MIDILDILDLQEPFADVDIPPAITATARFVLTAYTDEPVVSNATARFVMRAFRAEDPPPPPPIRVRFTLRALNMADYPRLTPPPAAFVARAFMPAAAVYVARFTLRAIARGQRKPTARFWLTAFVKGSFVGASPFRNLIPRNEVPLRLERNPMSEIMTPDVAAKDLVSGLIAGWLDAPTGKIGLFSNDKNPARGDLIGDYTPCTYDGYLQLEDIDWNDPVKDDDGNWVLVGKAPVQFKWHHTAEDPSIQETAYGWYYTTGTDDLRFASRFDVPQDMKVEDDSITFLPVYRYPGTKGPDLDS